MADRGWVSLVWPIPSSKTITQRFGANYNHYKGMGWKIGHSGLDIRTKTSTFPSGIGTPIVAVRGGTIRYAGWHFYANGEKTGYGIAIEIDHTDGTRTLYGHLSKVHVKKGQKVSAGERIADGGNTGNSSGPHLHFELWKPPFNTNGVWGRIDPTPYIEDIDFGGFGKRSLDDPEADDIHFERSLDDAICNCGVPYIPEE